MISLFMAAIGSVPALGQDQSLQPRATLTVETLKQLDRGLYKVPDSHNLLLTYIPAGEFMMGSPKNRNRPPERRSQAQRKDLPAILHERHAGHTGAVPERHAA